MTMKHLTTSLAFAALTFAAFTAPAHAIGTPKADEFVKKAAIAGMFEVESSKIALARSSNPEIKAFAQKMVDDHTAAAAKLKTIADANGLSAAAAAPLDQKHQKKLDNLKEEDAEDFDEDYADIQEKAHRKTVALFKDYSKDGDNAALKTFATETLPTLEHHKTEANALEEKFD